MNNNSAVTISLAKDYISPTPDPETSRSPPMSCTKDSLEPTTDCGIQPAAMYNPEPATTDNYEKECVRDGKRARDRSKAGQMLCNIWMPLGFPKACEGKPE